VRAPLPNSSPESQPTRPFARRCPTRALKGVSASSSVRTPLPNSSPERSVSQLVCARTAAQTRVLRGVSASSSVRAPLPNSSPERSVSHSRKVGAPLPNSSPESQPHARQLFESGATRYTCGTGYCHRPPPQCRGGGRVPRGTRAPTFREWRSHTENFGQGTLVGHRSHTGNVGQGTPRPRHTSAT